MTKKAAQAAREAEARANLLKLLKPGDTVYTVLKHVSSSGMSRVIDLVIPVMVEKNEILPASAKGFKVGVDAYAIPSDDRNALRAFSTGVVTAFDAETVTISYQEAHQAPAVVLTWPREQVKFYRKTKKLGVRSISYLAADLPGYKWDDRGGLKIGGCGMDMGFHAVYSLGSMMWPNGTKMPHSTRNGKPDRAGGYALKHQWL